MQRKNENAKDPVSLLGYTLKNNPTFVVKIPAEFNFVGFVPRRIAKQQNRFIKAKLEDEQNNPMIG